MCKYGATVKQRTLNPKVSGLSLGIFVSFSMRGSHKILWYKRKFSCGRSGNLGKVARSSHILEWLTGYLRYGGSVSLRAMEKCICSVRCIKRKMRSNLPTVYLRQQVAIFCEEEWGMTPYQQLSSPQATFQLYASIPASSLSNYTENKFPSVQQQLK